MMGHRVMWPVPLAALLLWAGNPATEFAAGVSALQAGDLARAEQAFQAVLKLQPGHAGALGNLGVVYSRMGRPVDAVRVYARALRVNPKDVALLVNLGLAHLKLDQHGQAAEAFKRALALDPANVRVQQLLAGAQIYTGETQAAVKTLEKLPRDAGVLYFLSLGYLKLGERAKAATTMQQMFSLLSEPQALFLRGKALYESGLFEEALASLVRAQDLQATLPGLQLELGKVYLSLRDAQLAESCLRRALDEPDSQTQARYYLGALLVQNGRVEEGAEHLSTVVKFHSEMWGALYYLGRARLEQRRLTEAVGLLERAARLAPEQPAVFQQLARAYAAAGRRQDSQRAAERLRALSARKRQREQGMLGKE
jgi:tetratricopeptide (TPR) repeat protein